jgi:3-deoxy-manno-octulosonate cytidylyltransferase (CMP-KDO synthetase)
MQATRLPGKPLADIHGKPMIVHVWRRAVESNAGRVIVATDSVEILQAVKAAGGEAIMTRADHASGSDRIHEAVTKVDPQRRAKTIVNLQGDLPTLDPGLVAECVAPLASGETDIATLAALISDDEERGNPNVVKVVGTPIGENRLNRAPWRWTSLSPHRYLCLPARQPRTLRRPASGGARKARETRTTTGA